MRPDDRGGARRQSGAGLLEATLVLPLFLFIVLATVQAALVFHAKGSANYATFEAARAGTVHNARIDAIHLAFQKAMLPYYGGGRTPAELAATAAKVAADLGHAAVRVQILSPTQESFEDFASPERQAALKLAEPVIPNVGLDELVCPRDVPGCDGNPATNRSGQTLLDANLLKLRVTFGIPPGKQMPLVGRFYTWALEKTGATSTDPFATALVQAGRIPLVTHTVMRMQSEAFRNAAMVSRPGPGNAGTPKDPGAQPSIPLPSCPWWDPACQSCPDGADSPKCTPLTCS